MTIEATKQRLRAALRVKGRAQSLTLQQQYSQAICSRLLKHLVTTTPCSIAGYHAFSGEPELLPALTALHASGWSVGLPVIDSQRDGAMAFHHWSPTVVMTNNRYGIPEPQSAPLAEQRVEIVLIPLLGFDRQGNRLGMGGGYYDRWLQVNAGYCLRIGIAYQWQQQLNIPTEAWDQSLDWVITDSECLHCHRDG